MQMLFLIQTVHPQGLKNSRRWLQEHALAYHGQWVAVYDGILVEVAETLQMLKERVTQTYPLESLLITKVY